MLRYRARHTFVPHHTCRLGKTLQLSNMLHDKPHCNRVRAISRSRPQLDAKPYPGLVDLVAGLRQGRQPRNGPTMEARGRRRGCKPARPVPLIIAISLVQSATPA